MHGSIWRSREVLSIIKPVVTAPWLEENVSAPVAPSFSNKSGVAPSTTLKEMLITARVAGTRNAGQGPLSLPASMDILYHVSAPLVRRPSKGHYPHHPCAMLSQGLAPFGKREIKNETLTHLRPLSGGACLSLDFQG